MEPRRACRARRRRGAPGPTGRRARTRARNLPAGYRAWHGPALRHRLRRQRDQGRARRPGGRRLRRRAGADPDPGAVDPRGGRRGPRRPAGPVPRSSHRRRRDHRARRRTTRRRAARRPTSTRRGSAPTPTPLFTEATGRDVHVVNDADAAGLAEVRYGAARGRRRPGHRDHPRHRHRLAPWCTTGCWCRTPSSATSRSTATTPSRGRPTAHASGRTCPWRSGPSG